MISARLHDYVVKAILHKLVRADAENVRFWHTADELTELRSYMSDQRSLLTAFFVNQRGAGQRVSGIR
ncbi:hypothetical protein C1N72_00830 [Pantoea ananatis]